MYDLSLCVLLNVPHFQVFGCFISHQLLVTATFHNFAIAQDQYLISVFDGRKSMSNTHTRLVLGSSSQSLENVLLDLQKKKPQSLNK